MGADSMAGIKIAFIGNENSGKMSLLSRFKDNKYDKGNFQKFGGNVEKIIINSHEVSVINIEGEDPRLAIDTPVSLMIQKPQAVVINLAFPKLKSEFNLDRYFKKIEKEVRSWVSLCNSCNKEIPLLLALNKCDQLSEEQIIELSPRLDKLAKELNIQSVKITSAKNNLGVSELFNEAASYALNKISQDKHIDTEIKAQRSLNRSRNFLATFIRSGAIIGIITLPVAGAAILFLATAIVGIITVGLMAKFGAKPAFDCLKEALKLANPFTKKNQVEAIDEREASAALLVSKNFDETDQLESTLGGSPSVGRQYLKMPATDYLLKREQHGNASTAQDVPTAGITPQLKK